MLIIILFLLILLFTIIEHQRKNNFHQAFFIFSLFSIVLLESIKFDSGMDFWNTYNHYQFFKLNDTRYRYEFLYKYLVFFFRNILNFSYPFFLFFYYSVIYGLYYFSLNKVTKYPISALLLLFACTVGLFGSNRQLLAIALGFFAYVYFLKDKKIFYLAFVLIATLFHYSAFLYVFLLFLDRRISDKIWMVTIVVFLLLNITGFNLKIFNFIIYNFAPEKISDIIRGYNTGFPEMQSNYYMFIIGIIRRSLPIFLMIRYKNFLQDKSYYQLLLNTLFFSLATYVFFFGKLEYMSSRVSIYFIIFEIILYVWLIPVMNKIYKKNYYLLFVILLASIEFVKYVFSGSSPFIPFKTLFFSF
ncbi:EpsG family protein [Chryseobacterium gambrini]|uniref:EpsG family protein n=1 Tax=Chryseobacterium gambrini TaxID=373672 RepID=UPI003D0A06BA